MLPAYPSTHPASLAAARRQCAVDRRRRVRKFRRVHQVIMRRRTRDWSECSPLSGVRMLVLAGRMLDGKDDDFLSFVIDGVVDQIGVTLRHELAYTLDLLLPP